MDEYQFFKSLCEKKSLDSSNLGIDIEILKKYFELLRSKGLDISFDGKIFHLNEKLIPLDEEKIISEISTPGINFIHKINIVYQTPSTNIDINNYDEGDEFTILLAEYQSLGKGRRGNRWISPIGKNIYLTIKFNEKFIKNISRFPIDIATIIAENLYAIGLKDIKIKWPNDIYVNDSKLGGLIVERILNPKNRASLILGIGINVNMDKIVDIDLDRKIVSLKRSLGVEYFDRNLLLAHLLPALTSAIKNNLSSNISSIKSSFEKYNLLINQELYVKQDNKEIFGKYVDINDDGSLKIFSNGEYIDLYAGDVSIKGWNRS